MIISVVAPKCKTISSSINTLFHSFPTTISAPLLSRYLLDVKNGMNFYFYTARTKRFLHFQSLRFSWSQSSDFENQQSNITWDFLFAHAWWSDGLMVPEIRQKIRILSITRLIVLFIPYWTKFLSCDRMFDCAIECSIVQLNVRLCNWKKWYF